MGRELRRVPLDFDWPFKERWHGYVNPHYHVCPECEGRGEDASRQFVNNWIRMLGVAADESQCTVEESRQFDSRQRIYPHPYIQEAPLYVAKREDLGPGLVDLMKKLAKADDDDRSDPFGMRFSSGAIWGVFKTLMEAAGFDEDWGICQMCEGEGRDPDHEAAYNAWVDFDPPEGEGFQMWETTSEGSPASPVFATLEELSAWCAENATTFGRSKASKEAWMKMLDDGLVYHQEGRNLFL